MVISEDGFAAFETLRTLAPKLLRLVHRDTATHRILFEPGEKTRSITQGNLWKSRNRRHHAAQADLLQALATKILEDDVPGYVLFHVDGDRPWHEQESSENVQKFDAFVQRVGPTVASVLERRGFPSTQTDVQARLRRICRVSPFYSIEAWLYQNTERARVLCQQRCGKHLELIGRWEADRKQLDEISQPKDHLCIGSHENLELAKSFTHGLADELYLLGQSFYATVERLQSCPGLEEALRATWADDSSVGSRS